MANNIKPPLEATISKKIIERLKKIRGCWAEKVPGGFFASGKPDITGCYYGRRFDFEVKRTPKQTASVLQQWNLDRWKEAGGVAATVICVEDVLNLLNEVAPVEYLTAAELVARTKAPQGRKKHVGSKGGS